MFLIIVVISSLFLFFWLIHQILFIYNRLLDSNLFIHRNTYAILWEATSETNGPRVYLLSYKFSIYFSLQSLLSNLYHKNTKNIYLILLSLSDLTFASYCEGIDNPFIALVAWFLFVCVGTRDFWGASYWIDTLVLKNWGKYLRYFVASSFPLQVKTNTCSRGRNAFPFKRKGRCNKVA